jgi:scyllo-inositol 2-dehydrogenase (NADP+)
MYFLPPSVKNNFMDEFKWGIVGPGDIAKDFLKDLSYVDGKSHRVVAVLSDKEESAHKFAREHGVAIGTTDHDKFFDADLQAIYIATPHPFHEQYTEESLRRGVPVLCEKPMALNSEQASRMVDAAVKYRCFFMEGMWIRFLPSIKLVLDLLEQEIIGRVISVRASMSFHAPHDEGNRYFNPDLGGGSLLDLGIYPVFLSQLVLGKPNNIKAVSRLTEKNIDEASAMLFEYQDGQYAVLDSSIVEQTPLVAHIYGEKGHITIDKPWNEQPAGIVVSLYDGTNMQYPCEWEGRGFQFEVMEMMRCLDNQEISSPLMSHQSSLDLIETLDDIREQTGIRYKQIE